jgi:hypothetical protein
MKSQVLVCAIILSLAAIVPDAAWSQAAEKEPVLVPGGKWKSGPECAVPEPCGRCDCSTLKTAPSPDPAKGAKDAARPNAEPKR